MTTGFDENEIPTAPDIIAPFLEACDLRIHGMLKAPGMWARNAGELEMSLLTLMEMRAILSAGGDPDMRITERVRDSYREFVERVSPEGYKMKGTTFVAFLSSAFPHMDDFVFMFQEFVREQAPDFRGGKGL